MLYIFTWIVECRYNAVQYNMILHVSLQAVRQNNNHSLHPQRVVCHVTYLPISPQERPRFELSYLSNLPQPVEFEIVRTEN